MSKDLDLSEEQIEKLIKEVEKADFMMANIARMVIHGGFHQNEVLRIKIKDILDENGRLVSEIQPFLPKETKEYTKRPISLSEPVKSALLNHIKKLGDEGYNLEGDAPLFPDNKEGGFYTKDKLIKHFKKHFGEITMRYLWKSGTQKKNEKLAIEIPDSYVREEELRKFSRHSRPGTTKKLIEDDVDEGGKPKKRDRPWEMIVRSIEQLTTIPDADARKNQAEAIEREISTVECDPETRLSLRRLLEEYKSRPVTGIQSQSNHLMHLSEMINKLEMPDRKAEKDTEDDLV